MTTLKTITHLTVPAVLKQCVEGSVRDTSAMMIGEALHACDPEVTVDRVGDGRAALDYLHRTYQRFLPRTLANEDVSEATGEATA